MTHVLVIALMNRVIVMPLPLRQRTTHAHPVAGLAAVGMLPPPLDRSENGSEPMLGIPPRVRSKAAQLSGGACAKSARTITLWNQRRLFGSSGLRVLG